MAALGLTKTNTGMNFLYKIGGNRLPDGFTIFRSETGEIVAVEIQKPDNLVNAQSE